MAALLWGAMIMVGVGVGGLVGGNPANISTTILVMITLVLWSVLFLALVFMDVMREVMLQRMAQGAVRKALQKTLDRRLVVVSAALSLIAGSLTMRYVDGDLDWGPALLVVAFDSGLAFLAILILEFVLKKQRQRSGSDRAASDDEVECCD